MRFFFRPTKEMVLILVIALLPVFIFGIIAVNRSVEVAQKAAEKEDEILVTNLANQTRLHLRRAEDIIKSLAALPLEDINENSLGAVYENNSFQNLPMLESLIVLDEEGILKTIYPPKEELLELDYSRQPFFDFVKTKNEIFFSRVKFSSVTEQPVVGIAAPIFEKEDPAGTLIGVIQGFIRLQGLSSLVKEFGLERITGEAFLVNQFGEIIAHPDYHLVREQENIANINPDLTKELRETTKERGTFQYSSSEGVEYLVSFQTISPTNWKLIIQQEMGEVLATPSKLRQFLLIILALTFLGAGVISYRVASYVVQLKRKWERIREERLKELEEIKSTLEVRVMARTRQLREQAEALRKENEEKTKELRERLEELERFHRVTVGRELKMLELKKQVRKMEAQLRETNLALKNYAKNSKKEKKK
ncbi:cache domain-containing protein [Patescibacteria group bacterium]|nr:cache domain-containing protein [Patescibacteria group bacterium]